MSDHIIQFASLEENGYAIGGFVKDKGELIHCKDCAKHYTERCPLMDQAFPVYRSDDWFCGDAIKKTERMSFII